MRDRVAADLLPYLRERRPHRLRVSDAAARHLAAAANVVKPSTLREMRTSYRLISEKLGSLYVDEVTGPYLDALMSLYEAGEDRQRKRKAKTVGKVKGLIRVLFKWCVEQGCAERNPCNDMLLKFSRKTHDRMRARLEVLTLPQTTRVLYARELPFESRWLYTWQLLTGARPGEVAGANIEHVSIANRQWQVCQNYDSKESRIIPETKTALIRYAPLHLRIVELWTEFEHWFKFRFHRAPRPTDPLCPFPEPGRVAGRWDQQTVLRRWRADLLSLDIHHPASGPRRNYATRHTFCTRLSKLGVPERFIRMITHADAEGFDAFETYVHAESCDLLRAIDAYRLDGRVTR